MHTRRTRISPEQECNPVISACMNKSSFITGKIV